MNNKIAIVDYQAGNLFSVVQMFKNFGCDVTVTADKNIIRNAKALVLPGVGAFGDAMKTLDNLGLSEEIKMFVNSGKPFMGICLGFQLLFDESDEFAFTKGLGIVKGRVTRFPEISAEQKKIRIPQIAWNSISKPDGVEWSTSPLNGLDNDTDMYFVHSYYVLPEEDVSLSITEYEGIKYTSSIFKENIFACQFHPEKSAKCGIRIYENWLTINNIK